MNTSKIKNRIKTVKNIKKITYAMQMVAASKMIKAQKQALNARAYTRAIEETLALTIQSVSKSNYIHPLLNENKIGRPVIVVFTTDKGFCSSLNTLVLNKLEQWVVKHNDPFIIMIGKKGIKYIENRAYLSKYLYAQFQDFKDTISIKDTVSIMSLIKNGFIEQKFKSVDILYPDFINTLVQRPTIKTILPINKVKIANFDKKTNAVYTFEPDLKSLLDKVLPLYFENILYLSFLELKASEFSARMISMKNATENADELNSQLRLIYNKTRQEKITNEILDINKPNIEE